MSRVFFLTYLFLCVPKTPFAPDLGVRNRVKISREKICEKACRFCISIAMMQRLFILRIGKSILRNVIEHDEWLENSVHRLSAYRDYTRPYTEPFLPCDVRPRLGH